MWHYAVMLIYSISALIYQGASLTCPKEAASKYHANLSSMFVFSFVKSDDPVVINSAPNTMKATSYVLKWRSPDTHHTVNSYIVRYRESVSNPTGNVTMEWCYVSTVGNHTLYNITGLLSDTLYQVEVVSVLGSKKFSQPAMSSFRTGPGDSHNSNHNPTQFSPHVDSNLEAILSVPDPPVLKVTDTSGSSISLMWYPPSNGGSPITGYKVQMKQSGRSWRTRKGRLPADTMTHAVRGLRRGVSYKFRVIAINSIGESPPSPAKSSSTRRTRFTSRPEITGAEIRNNASQVCVTWKFNRQRTAFSGFFVLLHNNGTQKPMKKKIKNPKSEICISAKLRPDTEYSVRMQAFNMRRRSPPSNKADFMIPAELPPGVTIPVLVPDYEDGDNDMEPGLPDRGGGRGGTGAIEGTSHNDGAWVSVSQRDIAILIAGSAFLVVFLALVASAVVYNKLLSRAKQTAKNGGELKPGVLSRMTLPKSDASDVCNSPPYSPSSNGCCSRDGCQRCGAAAYSDAGDLAHSAGMCPCHQHHHYPGVDDWVRGTAGEFGHLVPNDAKRPVCHSIPQPSAQPPLLSTPEPRTTVAEEELHGAPTCAQTQ